ncbi:hypothetical protein OJAV_G00178870 [Oryzias javanicus]|uniref:Uncharacterized protein n=1 Tax=Oryzias javanicus TaxID=123683 RepID=A0A3S2U0Z9_ORYJA|nr:hypothetical protein OJAV_G00178870 [Oryzias javanicus]
MLSCQERQQKEVTTEAVGLIGSTGRTAAGSDPRGRQVDGEPHGGKSTAGRGYDSSRNRGITIQDINGIQE